MSVRWIVLYISLAFGANAVAADQADLSAMREGDMRKLVVHSKPNAVPNVPFVAEGRGDVMLSDFEGKVVLVNFWATWCAPCRKEMPMLSELQADLYGPQFEVLTIATGRNPEPAMKAFFREIRVNNLPMHKDPKQRLARAMGVFGLPVTVVIDKNGQEVGRLQGDADWNSSSAKTIIKFLMAQ